MIGNFVDKKALQEILTILKQRVLHYNATSKDKIPDISFLQQDKINRFLNLYSSNFREYLIEEDTYQHIDYFRILSKEIKVFNFGRSQKFRQSHYDGIYIILKGSIEETIQENVSQKTPQFFPSNSKNRSNKVRISELNKMKNIVNMVTGINKIKDSLNSSRRESLTQSPQAIQLTDSQFSRPLLSSFSRPQKNDEYVPMAPIVLKNEVPNISGFKKIKEDSESSSDYATPASRKIVESSKHRKETNQLNFSNYFNLIENGEKLQVSPSHKSLRQSPIKSNEKAFTYGQVPQEIVRSTAYIGQEQNKQPTDSFLVSKSTGSLSSFNLNLMQLNSPVLSSINSLQKQPFQYLDCFNRVHKIIQAGEALNLIKVNEQENKYVTCDNEDCVCIYIGKKSMHRAFRDQIEELRWKTQILERFFHNVPSNKILKLAYNFQDMTLYKNQLVYQIGDRKPFYVYIIKSGEVQISESSKPKREDSEEEEEQEEIQEAIEEKNGEQMQINHQNSKLDGQNMKDQEGQLQEPLQQPKKIQNSKSKSNIQRSGSRELQDLCLKKLNYSSSTQQWKKDNVKNQVLCQLSSQELFGLEELIKKQNRRHFSACVTTFKADFCILSSEQFLNFYQTEQDSINLWFKQKEIFLNLQRQLLKRINQESSQSSTPSNKQAHQFVPKEIKKQCKYLFQEDEESFEQKMESLQKKKYISLNSYKSYKSYYETRHKKPQSNQQQFHSHFSLHHEGQSQQLYPQMQQSLLDTMQANENIPSQPNSHFQPNVTQSLISFQKKTSIPSSQSITFTIFNQLASEPIQHIKGDLRDSNVLLQSKNQITRQSTIEEETHFPFNQETSQKKISRLFSSQNADKRQSIISLNESTFMTEQDKTNNSTMNMKQKYSVGYVSNSKNIIREDPKSSHPHLGKIHSMIKDNKVIAKQQLKWLGGEVNFKKPIFDELKSENLKQALKYIHKKNELQNPNQNGEYMNGSLSDRSHISRTEQYSRLLKKVSEVQQQKEQQQQYQKQQQQYLQIQNHSKSSLTSQCSLQLVNTSRTQQTVGTGCSMPIVSTEDSFVTSPQILNSAPILNIHMKNKRMIEKGAEPYFNKPFSRVEFRNKKQKFKIYSKDEESTSKQQSFFKSKVINKSEQILCQENGYLQENKKETKHRGTLSSQTQFL